MRSSTSTNTRIPVAILIALCSSLQGVLVWSAKEPCSYSDVSGLAFCNTSLPVRTRAIDLVSRLTTDEKIEQLMMEAPPIERLHMDAYNYWSESLHGVLSYCSTDDNKTRCPTCYPMPIGMGATFHQNLVHRMATQISSEARRFFVQDAGKNTSSLQDRHVVGLDFWAPNINIVRDPRWGRAAETPGEDPFLSGQYALSYIKGMQQGDDDPSYLKTIATLKHFAGYSLEHWNGSNRMSFNAIISDQDLAQTYLPAFQVGITQGRAGSVMCSYNAVNGVPSCANDFLLQTLLREQWDWDGYVVSDCGAISYVYRPHKYKPTPEQAVAASLQAGTDLDCGNYYQHLKGAMQNELITETDLDRALVRLFSARIKLGMFDPWHMQPYMNYPPDIIGHPSHVETALQAARESIVLLKHTQNVLPLDKKNGTKIAVLGPHIHAKAALCGTYHGTVPSNMASPLEALQAKFATVFGMEGCDINSNNTDGFAAAAQHAKEADVAILFMGTSTAIEQEGKDRYEIGLPGVQEALIDAIAQVQNKTILVLINGGPLDVFAAKDNPHVVAILEAFYPGMKGAEAIVDVLLGTYSPSGRLPYTMYKKDYVDQISMTDMSMTSGPGRTYRYFKGEVVYPFGYGLSYTSFEFKFLDHHGLDGEITEFKGPQYRVNVTNTGPRASDVSVLAFVSFEGSDKEFACPLSQLFGFQKIHLQPNESKTVFFSVAPASLKCYGLAQQSLSSPVGTYSVTVGSEHQYFHYYANASISTASAEAE